MYFKNLFSLLILVLIVVLCSNCGLKTPYTVIKKLPPLPESEAFCVFKVDESLQYSEKQVVGDIQIKDSGLTLNCDYDEVLELAKDKARQMGANALKIYEHKLPTIWGSSCHRIKAKALYLEDAWKYEKEIKWNSKRPLKIRDFKADTARRPFQAATMSGISYRYGVEPFKWTGFVEINTVFDSKESYFKIQEDSIHVLAHEQLHFDISELYARKFAEMVKINFKTIAEFQQKHGEVYKKLMSDLHKEQNSYDYDVYANESKQKDWKEKIDKELQQLSAFADKKVFLKKM